MNTRWKVMLPVLCMVFLLLPLSTRASSGAAAPWPSAEISGDFSQYLTEEHRNALIASGLKEKPVAGTSYPFDIVYQHQHCSVAKDGSTVTYQDAAVRVNTLEGKQMMGEQVFPYDSDRQTVDLLRVEVYLPDGSKVVTDAATSTRIKEPFTGLVYSNLKMKTLTVKGLEEGSVLRMITRHIHRPDVMKGFALLSLTFDSPVPVKEFLSIAQIEKGMKIVKKERLTRSAPEIKTGIRTGVGGVAVHFHRAANIKPTIREPKSVPVEEIDNRIYFVSEAKWSDVSRFCENLYASRITAGKDVSDKARELAEGLKTRDEKIKALYDFVKEIRYLAIHLGQGGYVPRAPDETFRNKYGDCKDKSVLLLAMLRSIGIDGHVALVRTSSLIDKGMASPLHFDHVIAALKDEKGNYRYLDATGSATPYGLIPPSIQFRNALILGDERAEPVVIPQQAPQQNRCVETMEVELKDIQTAIGTNRTARLTSNELSHTIPKLPEPMLKQIFYESMASKYKSLEVLSLTCKPADSGGVLRNEYKVKIGDFTKKMGKWYVFNPLFDADRPGEDDAIALQSRTTDVEFDVPSSIDATVTYRIPDSVTIEFAPKPFSIKNDKFGSYVYEVDQSPGRLQIRRKMDLTTRRVSAKDYKEFRDFYLACLKQEEEMVGLNVK